MSDTALWAARAVLVAVGLALWFWTQKLIGQRPFPPRGIGDAVHDWTASWNRWLNATPRAANVLLVASSAVIDLLGVFLLGAAIFGPTFRPFVGLLLLYALRQLCQGLCAFAPPEGMIWRSPGFPSVLVTYGTATDLFFSGHTAIAVYGALELARLGGGWFVLLGVAIVLFEAAVVLVLRAHYTADVFAAIVTAIWAAGAAEGFGPVVDRALNKLLHAF
jgi:PAP2 superfamily C-terminal